MTSGDGWTVKTCILDPNELADVAPPSLDLLADVMLVLQELQPLRFLQMFAGV